MARVLLTSPLPAGGADPLVSAGFQIEGGDRGLTRPELLNRVAGVDAIISTLRERVDAGVLDAAGPSLRVVANVAVGYDNIDVAAAHARNVVVCNTPGVLDDATADVAFLLLLAAARLASEAEADLRGGRWRGWALTDYLGCELSGATLGLVGYGRIGRAMARRARGFDLTVIHTTRRDTGEPGWLPDLDGLLERSDFVSLHVPLTPDTRHLMDRDRLGRMGPQSVLVNTSRGAIVDEAALADALESGAIFAAGLDVFDNEPAVNPRLLAAPRTVLLPHIGSATQRTRSRMALLACTGVVDVLAGRAPAHRV
jgi:glyoxylate reductase